MAKKKSTTSKKTRTPSKTRPQKGQKKQKPSLPPGAAGVSPSAEEVRAILELYEWTRAYIYREIFSRAEDEARGADGEIIPADFAELAAVGLMLRFRGIVNGEPEVWRSLDKEPPGEGWWSFEGLSHQAAVAMEAHGISSAPLVLADKLTQAWCRGEFHLLADMEQHVGVRELVDVKRAASLDRLKRALASEIEAEKAGTRGTTAGGSAQTAGHGQGAAGESPAETARAEDIDQLMGSLEGWRTTREFVTTITPGHPEYCERLGKRLSREYGRQIPNSASELRKVGHLQRYWNADDSSVRKVIRAFFEAIEKKM